MDAQTKLSREEFVLSMGQSSNDAAMKVAQIKPRKVECVEDTGQKLNPKDAAVMDAQIKLKMEESALSMGQHGERSDAAMKDV
jgi:hypothetical protein